MNKKILVFTTEMLPGLGYPTAGGGIRAWQIGEGLKSHGYQVIYSLPALVVKNKPNLPQEILDTAHSFEKMNEVIDRIQPDLVICIQWHSANRLRNPISVPVVLDLFGLRVLEDAYLTGFELDAFFASKIEALAKADYFICATDMQKAYFIPWLIIAGIDPKENCIGSIPVSLSPQLPQMPVTKDAPTFVYGGLFWPWQNPFPALNAVIQTMDKLNRGTLKIYGSKHPYWKEFPGPYSDPKKELVSLNRVEFIDLIQHEQLMQEYLNATAAIDLPVANHERFLAFPIRSVCYLWSGVPLLVSRVSPLAAYIEKYTAGWVLEQKDTESISRTIEQILRDPNEAYQRGKNAQQLVAAELTWDKTITPLVEFCQNPKKLDKQDSIFKQLAVSLAETNQDRGRLGSELKQVWEMLNQTRDELRDVTDELRETKQIADHATHDLNAIRSKLLFRLYKKIQRLLTRADS
ncbi:MAG: glycosyltransferase family 4 protein [bacterium]|nr:glycosyltransferase family 4 protein [bacterium]